MTEANMKKLYDWFVRSKQPKRAEEILKIERYAKFSDESTKDDVDYSAKGKAALKVLAEEKGLDFEDDATKDDLIVILETKSDGV